MEATQVSNSYFSSANKYEQFMGRYARPLAKEFVETIPLASGDAVLEIGCGPGALTGELVNRLGADAVSAIDPSPPFLEYCAGQYPGIHAEIAPAEHIPFGDQVFDAVLSQLVVHFIGDLAQAGREIRRVTRPGGHVMVCGWNIGRMQKINLLPRAAHAAGIDTPAPSLHTFEDEGSLADYLESIGLVDVEGSTITVTSTYSNLDDLWDAYLAGIGPFGPWTLARTEEERSAMRAELFRILGKPAGVFTLSGEANVAYGHFPA